MVIRAEVLDQMVLPREAIAALARAVLDGTIAEDGEMHAGLVALQVCEAGERAAAVVAGEGFSWSSGCDISIDFSGCRYRLCWIGTCLLGLRRCLGT